MIVFPFPELETDAEAIAAFVARENARTEAVFPALGRAADEAMIRAILEAPDDVPTLSRRGSFIYTFRHTAEHPRGLWQRVADGEVIGAETRWQTIFDLDAFCAGSGTIWEWRGGQTSPFNANQVLVQLSREGSDLTRSIEFNLESLGFVAGGFDVGPDRSWCNWAGADRLIVASALEGDATHTGWPGTLRLLERGQSLKDAPVLFRTSPEHLEVFGYLSRLGGPEWTEIRWEETEIGKAHVTLLREGQTPLLLPNPADTSPALNHAFCAWVANEQGEHRSGTLVLSRHDGSSRRVLFTPREGAVVRSWDVFFLGDWLVWTEMRDLRPHVMALDTRVHDAEPQEIVPPLTAESVWVFPFDVQPDLGDGTMIMTATGFLTPNQAWLFDLSQSVEGIRFRPLHTAPARFDATGCTVALWSATSEDGTEIPYHVVLPRDHEGKADLPVLLYGYGGFGFSEEPGYLHVFGKMWVERGGAYAVAHIRGGGEFGPAWHETAKGAGRHRSFADFAAVAADLVARGITTPQRIACHGGSNGGLLCGVMLTRYPERFGAVWADVGVYDMLNYTRFPTGRGWIDEYGDPENPEARAWLSAYSPIHNVPPCPLPPVLLATGGSDDRVDPSHSRRFAAALQAAGHEVYFMEHRGGHGGGGASFETAREMALGLAFLRRALKIDQ